MSPSVPYNEYKIKWLQDPEYAKAYLETALEEYHKDGEQDAFLTALCDVVEAWGGIPEVSKKVDKSKRTVYIDLTCNGTPRLDVLECILNQLGFRLSIEPIES